MRGVWKRWRAVSALVLGLGLAALSGCGGGATGAEDGPTVGTRAAGAAAVANPVEQGNGPFQTVLAPVQPQLPAGSGAGGAASSLTIHYQRSNGDTTGWQVHSWGAAADPGWNQGHNPVGTDSFGAIYEIPLVAGSGNVGYLFHKGDDKDHEGADQSWTLKPGANVIWRRQGDPVTYTSPPAGGTPPTPDLHTVRVHYKRFDGNYAAWGLHLWPSSGIDTARIPAGVAIDQWGNAVGFDRMPGYAAGNGEVVFDIPVLNPKDNAARSAVEFIIHGKSPNENDKDGRPDNIRVVYNQLTVTGGVGHIWLVQGDAEVYKAAPDLRRVSISDARAFFLDDQLIQWPGIEAGGTVKLYHSANAQLVAVKDEPVRGADGSVTLEAFGGTPSNAVLERFKWIPAGPRFRLPAGADVQRLLRAQLIVVQENAAGQVQNATTLQLPGLLDARFARAERVRDLGLFLRGSSAAGWKLWAPTAQRVAVFVYPSPDAPAEAVYEASYDAATGIWSASARGNLKGKFYRYGVEVYVRGVGVVRNLVTDPYSLSLSANSKRTAIIDLDDPATQPPGWPAVVNAQRASRVQATPDMSIYELHVRDFSAQDATVPAALRGKYAAFTQANSQGMRHLKALADAGLTDIHLLPVYDFSSVPETGCTTPSPAGGPADETQQAAVRATQGADCFNWGYDPQHFGAPEGSYASNADDPVARVREFRSMVKALHEAGLRTGMDVVYNHTSASGQNERSVLDRIVPGYYHRLNAAGAIETSTCCENTAAEQRMMAKLMSDTALIWARQYGIASFRFDIMGHHPRSVLEDIKARLKAEMGRDVQLLGEGWNFGEVADGARFVQASMWSLNGSGIGTFSPFARDAIRGGGPMDGGDALVRNQGFVNGLYYDPNSLGGGRSRNDLMWQGDLIKAGLAGSIRSFTVLTHWGETKRLEELNGAGYVVDPSEVVNYVENHDNQTLFDNNAFKLPAGTSTEDRARVQILAAALNSFSQGIAYFHAGVDTLRSKSLDRNSYDAGDWFNRIDWSYQDNFYATGLPLAGENGANWGVMRPLLQDSSIKPRPADIAWTRDAFRDLLKIRASSTLFRLRTAEDIKARLKFHNTGPSQVETVLMASLDGSGYPGANFTELVYLVNVDKVAREVTVDALKGRAFQLHPVQAAAGAADQRVRLQAGYDAASGRFSLPARSAVVFVR